MKPQHDIRNLVRRRRLMADMTQQELSERVGVTRQTILSIEKGKYTPSVALAICLAEVFDVSVETLFQLNKGETDV
jgi:putative transcriptional regulator